MQLIEGSSRRRGDGGHWELITNHWDPPIHVIKLNGFGVKHNASPTERLESCISKDSCLSRTRFLMLMRIRS
jgi:hypothetical protein